MRRLRKICLRFGGWTDTGHIELSIVATTWPLAGQWGANGWTTDGQLMAVKWLANAWLMIGKWLANGWPMVGQWLANECFSYKIGK